LLEVGKRGVRAAILERRTESPQRRARIHLAVAPTKQQDRIEWLVEKAVEVGVDRFTPLIAARGERARLRTDRLLRVSIAAMKQSQRAWLPVIDEPITSADLLRQELPEQRLFGWCEGEHASLMERYTPTSDALVLIGPGATSLVKNRRRCATRLSPPSASAMPACAPRPPRWPPAHG